MLADRSQYGGGSGMYGGMPNPGMIPTMAQQAAMFSGGMRVVSPGGDLCWHIR